MNISSKIWLGLGAVCVLLLFLFGYRYNQLKVKLEESQREKAELQETVKLYAERLAENQKVTEETSKKISTSDNRMEQLKNEAKRISAAPVVLDTGRVSIIRAAIKEANTATAGQ